MIAKHFIRALVTLFLFTSFYSYASDFSGKCNALKKVAYSIQKTKNELSENYVYDFHSKNINQIDLSFVKFFGGVIYSSKAKSGFYEKTSGFCSDMMKYAFLEQPKFDFRDEWCSDVVNYSKMIEYYYSKQIPIDSLNSAITESLLTAGADGRILRDYLMIISSFKYSSAKNTINTDDFLRFSKNACKAFKDIAKEIN